MDDVYGVCPYCGFDAEAAVTYQSKQNNETLSLKEYTEEVEFYLYESHPDFCEGMRNSLKESETFEAVYDDYIISMKRNNPLSRHYIPPKKKYAAETFEAYNPEQPRDESGRWISDDEEMQSYITGAHFRRTPKQGSGITLRQLSEAVMETTHNHLDFDTAHELVNRMLSQHPAGDSQEARNALLMTLEETQMQLEYADEIGWDMDIEIMAGLLRSRGIKPPEEYEEAVINRLTFEDEWAAEPIPQNWVNREEEEEEEDARDQWNDKMGVCLHDWQDDKLEITGKGYGRSYDITAYCPTCDTTVLITYIHYDSDKTETIFLPGKLSASDFYDSSPPTYSAEEPVGYDKPLGESLNWTPYEYLDSKKIKPNKPTPAKDFDMGDTFGRNVLLMSETFESSNYKCSSCGTTFAQEDTQEIDGDIICDDCIYDTYDIDEFDAESFSPTKWETGDLLTIADISELITDAQDTGCLVTSFDAGYELLPAHLRGTTIPGLGDFQTKPHTMMIGLNGVFEIYTNYKYTDSSLRHNRPRYGGIESRFTYEHKLVYDFEWVKPVGTLEEELWELVSLEQPYAVSMSYPYHMEYIVQSTDPEDAADMAVRGEGKRSSDGDLSKYPIFSFPASVDWEPNSDEAHPLFD